VDGFESPRGVNANVALQLYRIAQEALNNAIKHGHASQVMIKLAAEEPIQSLTVQDDGVGFDVAGDHGSGMGLGIMRYRARMIGGTLSVESTSGKGTTVTCRFPTFIAD
jgi:two-component system CheB/CheR fusion protein